MLERPLDYEKHEIHARAFHDTTICMHGSGRFPAGRSGVEGIIWNGYEFYEMQTRMRWCSRRPRGLRMSAVESYTIVHYHAALREL